MASEQELREMKEFRELQELGLLLTPPPASRKDSVMAYARSLWQLAWPRRRLFFTVGLITAILSVALLLMIPQKYTARATILPANAKGGSMMGLLSQVASMAGISDGGSTESILALYPSIARSRTVLWDMLHMPYQNGTILTALTEDPQADSVIAEQTLRTVSENLVAKTDLRVGLVLVEYTLPDKELAAALVNGVLAQMDRFFRYNLMTEAKNKRLMIGQRLEEVADSLRIAEDRLQRFRQGNRAINGSPFLIIEEARLRREMDIQNTLYHELNHQYELAKIQEAADTPIMKVLDRATPPHFKSWPPRSRYLILLLALSQVATLLYLKLKPARAEASA